MNNVYFGLREMQKHTFDACIEKVKYDEFLNKVNEAKYGSDDEAFVVNDWKHFNKDIEGMKFDVVIGNPPYEGQGNPLYLQILEVVNKVSDKVVWLCPAQWVLCGKYNKWYQHYIDTLKCEDYQHIDSPFKDAGLANKVGIYTFGKNKIINLNEIKWTKFNNQILSKCIADKIGLYCNKENLGMYKLIDNNYAYYVNASTIRGNVHESKPCWDWTTLFGETQRKVFTKNTKKWMFWNFKTEKECKNFIASTETDILMFALYIVKFNNNMNRGETDNMPWFGDYTKEWTEPMIQKELGLTDEEVEYIHEEMKPFGWKAQPKKRSKK